MTVCLLSWQCDIWGYGFKSIFKKKEKRKEKKSEGYAFHFVRTITPFLIVNYGSTFLTKRDWFKTLWKKFPLNEEKISRGMGKYFSYAWNFRAKSKNYFVSAFKQLSSTHCTRVLYSPNSFSHRKCAHFFVYLLWSIFTHCINDFENRCKLLQILFSYNNFSWKNQGYT